MVKKTKRLDDIVPAHDPEVNTGDATVTTNDNQVAVKLEVTDHAIGIYKDSDGKYVLVKVGYNKHSKQTNEVEVVYKDIREDVIDKFKGLVDELNLFGVHD